MEYSRVGILGTGDVAKALAQGFLAEGAAVMLGSRAPEKLGDWLAGEGRGATASTFAEAAQFGDVLVLAVKGSAAEEVLDLAGPDDLAGKTILDATNPIADAPPVNGVLRYFTGPNESLLERLQAKVPAANFVKAFSCIGSSFMVQPDFAEGKPTMFLCGNSEAARRTAAGIAERFGFEPADMGPAEAARAIEPLAMLWCIPGFRENRWSHAFRLLRR